MKILIAEDEALSRERIAEMLVRYDPQIEIVKTVDNIDDAVLFYKQNPSIDLAFFDIKLSDGLSFEIFNQVDVVNPVIFTTAYDDFALRAFKVNSVDYILKPINFEELSLAIDKYKQYHRNIRLDKTDAEVWKAMTGEILHSYKKRFVVKFGDHIQIKNADEVGFFYADGKAVYLISIENGRKYLVDHTLEDLESRLLDPERFFRINRKYIVSIEAIADVRSYINSRLKITLKVSVDQELIVSRDRVNEFKNWLNQ